MIVSTPDVELEPSVQIFRWKIVKLKDPEGNITEHVAGQEYYDYARVSTAIIEKGDGFVITASGRKYTLVGEERKFLQRLVA